MAEGALTKFIADTTEIITAIFGFIPDIADAITSHPLLFFTVGFLFIGGCVGIFGRLLSRN